MLGGPGWNQGQQARHLANLANRELVQHTPSPEPDAVRNARLLRQAGIARTSWGRWWRRWRARRDHSDPAE